MKFYNQSPDDNHWVLETDESKINLNELLDEEVYEVNYLDEAQQLIVVNYTGFNGWEVMAMINRYGEICFNGICSVEEYYPELEKILITVQSDALSDELVAYHGLQSDEMYYAVIDLKGQILDGFSRNYIKVLTEE
jgi:hypothetical protein